MIYTINFRSTKQKNLFIKYKKEALEKAKEKYPSYKTPDIVMLVFEQFLGSK